MEPARPARKPRLPLAIGLLLIAAGIALLVLFTRDPKGALPGKGGPIVDGAGYQDGRTEEIEVNVPQAETELFLEFVKRRVSEERLLALLKHLHDAGEVTVTPDFDTIKINTDISASSKTKLTLHFVYAAHIHNENESIRNIAKFYAKAAIDVSAIEAAARKGRVINERVWWAQHWRDPKTSIESLCVNAHFAGNRRGSAPDLVKTVDVLIDGETDEKMSGLLKDVRKMFMQTPR